MSRSFEDYTTTLMKQHKLRVTQTRLAILKHLEFMDGSFTAKDIFQETNEAQQNFEFSTVYRTLLTFQEIGLIHSIGASGKFTLCSKRENFDMDEIHTIFKCTSCDSIEEKVVAAKNSLKFLKAIQGDLEAFSAKSVVLKIEGTCKACTAKH